MKIEFPNSAKPILEPAFLPWISMKLSSLTVRNLAWIHSRRMSGIRPKRQGVNPHRNVWERPVCEKCKKCHSHLLTRLDTCGNAVSDITLFAAAGFVRPAGGVGVTSGNPVAAFALLFTHALLSTAGCRPKVSRLSLSRTESNSLEIMRTSP